jgi:hypothetical protein
LGLGSADEGAQELALYLGRDGVNVDAGLA